VTIYRTEQTAALGCYYGGFQRRIPAKPQVLSNSFRPYLRLSAKFPQYKPRWIQASWRGTANRVSVRNCPSAVLNPPFCIVNFKGREMSYASKIALVAALVGIALGSTLTDASARGRLFPVTLCGPSLAYLCPIHGYFDQPPFKYNVAIYPGCIQMQRVETPHGYRRLPVLVCG
jgi:hypothetical protein